MPQVSHGTPIAQDGSSNRNNKDGIASPADESKEDYALWILAPPLATATVTRLASIFIWSSLDKNINKLYSQEDHPVAFKAALSRVQGVTQWVPALYVFGGTMSGLLLARGWHYYNYPRRTTSFENSDLNEDADDSQLQPPTSRWFYPPLYYRRPLTWILASLGSTLGLVMGVSTTSGLVLAIGNATIFNLFMDQAERIFGSIPGLRLAFRAYRFFFRRGKK